LRFALEPGKRLRITGNFLRQKLERDKAVQPGVFRLVDTPMPPPPSFSTMR